MSWVMGKSNQKLVQDIKKITREIRLEQEEMFGRPVSKIWDEKPSNRQSRKRAKEKLNNFNPNDDFDDHTE
jgi:hypothetical protein